MVKIAYSKGVYSVLLAASLTMLTAGWYLSYGGEVQYLNASELTIATVQSGDFTQKVNGYGMLQSLNQRLMTAPVAAIVEEIHLQPGADISADSVILTLKNPESEAALQRALVALQSAKTERRKLAVDQQRQILELESNLSQLRGEVEMADLQVDAETPLAQAGIISRLDAEKSKLKARQLGNRVDFEVKKFEKLNALHHEQLQIQEDAIAQAQAEFNSAREQLDALSVRAGINGILQRLSVSLGQSVSAGAELALVGSLAPLIAQIKVPQTQAHLVIPGAEAEIDTRHGIVTGLIIRTDPVVENGAVRVDIQLPEQLAEGVRPMQMVDAAILVRSRDNVHFLQKPAAAREDSPLDVFKLIDDSQARRVAVSFGKISGNRIEIAAGLAPGDRVIVAAPPIDDSINAIQIVK